MAQISRKELKSDEFVSGMDAAYEFVLQHTKGLIAAAVIIVVVVVAGYGVMSWRKTRNQKAGSMLAAGLTTLHAPIQATPIEGTTSYANVDQRAQVAVKQFQALIAQYGSTNAGQLGRYYLGLAELDLTAPDAKKKAAANLEAASRSGDATAAVAAQHALANLAIENGDLAKAHGLLLALTQQDSPTLPRAVALMELADLDRTYNPKEAAKYYQQLQTEYPNSSTADQAKQQLASLKQ